MQSPVTASSITQRIFSNPVSRRRFQRVSINVLGRFMLQNGAEYPCQVMDMSPGGAALIAPVSGQIGERIVAYIDHIGRIEGQITRRFEGGFAMYIKATARKRDKLATQLIWLANRNAYALSEDNARPQEKIAPRPALSSMTLDDGREIPAKIIDVSLSGAMLAVDLKPPLGATIMLGRTRAHIIGHHEMGITVEFPTLSPESIAQQHS